MSIMVASGKGATLGVLFRNAEAIEVLGSIDTLVVDKTGTLTQGKPELVSVAWVEPFSENEVLQLAASLERGSEHPLASAIVKGKLPALSVDDAARLLSLVGVGSSEFVPPLGELVIRMLGPSDAMDVLARMWSHKSHSHGIRAIEDEEDHRPSRDIGVWVAPCVAEIAPHVHQAETGERTRRVLRRDEFEVRIDQLRQPVRPTVVVVGARLAQRSGQLAAVTHQREDRDESPIMEPVPLHRVEEPLHGWLTQLRVSVHQLLPANTRLLRRSIIHDSGRLDLDAIATDP
jgi:hypothetical protein